MRKVTICRISVVLLVMLLWIGLWYSSTLPPPRKFSSGSLLVRESLVRNSSNKPNSNINGSIATFWEVEDRKLTDDLLGEVVEELDKIRKGISLESGTKPAPCNEETASNATKQENIFPSLHPVGPSLHSLVLSSVSRLSFEEFSAVGVASVDLRRLQKYPLIHSCAWVPKLASPPAASSLAAANDSSVVWSPVSIRFVNDSQKAVYDAVVITCSFDEPVGANGDGGFLVFNSSSSFDDDGKNLDYLPVFREKPDEITSIPFEGPFRFEYAHCSPLITTKLSKRFVTEWLLYHQGLWSGKIHYLIYDAGGVDEGLREVFQPLVKQGVMTIVDFRELVKFPGHEEQHAINDCLQRTRFLARWTLLWSFDEYFQMLNRSSSMATLLRTHENSPWISLGSMVWSRTYCGEDDDSHDEWAVQRMCFRLKHPTCGDEHRANTCHGVEGQRKWIANPRKVLMGTIHRTLEPEWNGVILDAAVARLDRFHELSAEGTEAKNCWIVKKLSEVDQNSPVDGWWFKDESLSEAARHLKI